MGLRTLSAALLVVVSTFASAQSVTVYNTAQFVQIGPGVGQLAGFGRIIEAFESPPTQAAVSPEATTVPFFDTWNIGVSSLMTGLYSFSNMTVNTQGPATIDSVTFNSYDAQGVRHTILFSANASGTQLVGSGTFTVLASCPVGSCVWIDVIGKQVVGGGSAGYGGSTVATPVPEPASGVLLLLGVAAVASLRRARRT